MRQHHQNLQLQDLLFTQGFGTRRVCAGLVQQGLVTVDGVATQDAGMLVEAVDGLPFTVQGQAWAYHALAYVMLHKPAGTECSHKPSAWPSIYTLLPGPLRQRPARGALAGVQAIGRLDQDTTGLLLLSDDGQFIHRMASPKHHVPKVYEVRTKHPVTPAQIERLCAGVVLDDDPKPVRAAAAEVMVWDDGPAREASAEAAEESPGGALRLTITEGKYHQVKRMVAAVGNRVVALHRSRIGALALPADLAPGQWRWLRADEVEALRQRQ